MADSDKILKLQIDLEKTGTGGVAAKAELEGVTAAANTGKDAGQELGKETEKTAEKFKLFSGEGREMHRVISELNRISPLLGEAFRIALNPIGGTIAAAIGLFVLIKQHINEVTKELDAMAEKAAEPTFLAGIRAKEAVLREAADAAAEYAQHLADIASSEESVTTQLTAQLALQKSINEARNAAATAEEALAQARIKAAVATGKMTPEQGDVASAEAKRKSIADEAKSKQDAQDQEVATKTSALEKLDVPGDQANAWALAKTYAKEKARREKNAKDFGDDKKNTEALETAKAAEEKKQKEIDEIESATRDMHFRMRNVASPEGKVAEDKRWADAQSKIAGMRHDAGADTRRIQAGMEQFSADQKNEPAFNALKISADEAKKKADESTKDFATLTAALKGLTDAIAANRATENITTRAKQTVVDYDEAAALQKGIGKTKEFETHMAGGHTTRPQQDAALAEAQSNVRALLQAVKDLSATHSEVVPLVAQELATMRAETLRLAEQIKNSRNRPTG